MAICWKKFPSAWQITEDPGTKKEKNEEYIVEFRVTIVDPEYSKLLNDPDGLQHDNIKQDLTAKVTFWPQGARRCRSSIEENEANGLFCRTELRTLQSHLRGLCSP